MYMPELSFCNLYIEAPERRQIINTRSPGVVFQHSICVYDVVNGYRCLAAGCSPGEQYFHLNMSYDTISIHKRQLVILFNLGWINTRNSNHSRWSHQLGLFPYTDLDQYPYLRGVSCGYIRRFSLSCVIRS